MELIADILLVAGALGAGLYCLVLSRRLKRFTNLEKGVGGAVAVLSTQADELKKSLDSARDASDHSGTVLKDLTKRAEAVAQRLELMMASMHDVVPPEELATRSEVAASQQSSSEVFEEVKEANNPGDDEDIQTTEPTADLKKEVATSVSVKRPSGLMFFRHDRSNGQPTT